MKKICRLLAFLAFGSALFCARAAAPLPVIDEVEWQPLSAQVKRLVEALDYQGAPMSSSDRNALNDLFSHPKEDASEKLQALLDPYCLFFVNVNPESRVKVA